MLLRMRQVALKFLSMTLNDNGGYNLDQSHVQQHDTEDDGDYQYSQQQQRRMLERDEDRRKENTAAAERWNDRGGLRVATTVGTTSRRSIGTILCRVHG